MQQRKPSRCKRKLSIFGMVFFWGILSLQASDWILQPSPWGMNAGQYEIRSVGAMNKAPGEEDFRLPWAVGLHFGFVSRAEFGIQLGESVSLAASALLSSEDQWIPATRFGFRSMIASVEGDFFAQDSLQGELFFSIGKSFGKKTKVLFGVQYFPRLVDERSQPYWGLTQNLSENWKVSYEGFGRFAELHHNLGFHYRPTENLEFEIGLLEMIEWVYQEGKVGFYMEGEEGGQGAYLQPGFYFGVRVSGIAGSHQQGSTEERLRRLEAKLVTTKEERDILGARLSRAEKSLAKFAGASVEIRKKVEVEALLYLDTLVHVFERGGAPELVRAWQDSVLSRGEPSEDLLIRLVENPVTEYNYREMALRIMAYDSKPRYVAAVLVALKHEHPGIRREALLALDRIGDHSVAEKVAELRKDPEELVAWLAETLYAKMKKEMKESLRKPMEAKGKKDSEEATNPGASSSDSNPPQTKKEEEIPLEKSQDLKSPPLEEEKQRAGDVDVQNPTEAVEKKLDSPGENSPMEQP